MGKMIQLANESLFEMISPLGLEELDPLERSFLNPSKCAWLSKAHGMLQNIRYTVIQAHLSSVIKRIFITFAVPGKPRDVFARPINSSTIEVRWSPPDDSDKNGQIRGYQIYVQPRNVGVFWQYFFFVKTAVMS